MKKYKFQRKRLIVTSVLILLITNFLLLIGLISVGRRMAYTQGQLAESQIRIARMLGIISARQLDPMFQFAKEDIKKEKK